VSDLEMSKTVGAEKLTHDAELRMTTEMDPSAVEHGVKSLWASFHGELPQAAKTMTFG